MIHVQFNNYICKCYQRTKDLHMRKMCTLDSSNNVYTKNN